MLEKMEIQTAEENHGPKDKVPKNDFQKEIFFEEALTLAGVGKYTYTLFAVSLFNLLCGFIELFSVSLISALAQCDLQLDVYKKGIVGSAPMMGIVVSAYIWGYIADTKGRKYCLILAMTGNFVFAFAAGFANSWFVLAFFKIFSTACLGMLISSSSGIHSVTLTILGEMTPESHRTSFMQFVGVTVTSQTFSAILVHIIQVLDVNIMIPYLNINYGPWRILTQLFALFSLINLITVKLFIFESAKYYFARGMETEGLEVLRKMYALNTGKSQEDYKPQSIVLGETTVSSNTSVNILVAVWRQTVPLFGREHIKSTLLISYLTAVVYSLTSPFIIWLPLILGYYTDNLNTSRSFCQVIQGEDVKLGKNYSTMNSSFFDNPQECNSHMSAFTLTAIGSIALYYATATCCSVFIIKNIGRKWLFIGTHIICSAMFALVNYIPSVVAVFVFMAASSTMVCMGVCAAFTVELFPTYLRAMAVCLTLMVGRGFSTISINLIGPQLENNCSSFIFIVAAVMFSGAIMGLFLPGKKKAMEPV